MVFLGTESEDYFLGTQHHDIAELGAGNDRARTLGGNDAVYLGLGADEVSAGPGDDVVYANETRYGDASEQDVIVCGEGWDQVYVDDSDVVKTDCEELNPRPE